MAIHKSTNQHTQSAPIEKERRRLLVISPLYPPHTGGLENHAEQFNQVLAARGHFITTWTPLITKQTDSHEQSGNLSILRFPAWEIIPNYPLPKIWTAEFWRQARFIVQLPCDLVISRTRFFITSPLAWLIARIKRRPWLHIEHGSDFVQSDKLLVAGLARLYDFTIGRTVFRLADALVGNSKASASFVRSLAPSRKVRVIYRGVDSMLIAQIAPAVGLYVSGKLNIGYIGRLIDGKGVADLIRTFAIIEQPGSQLHIIGDGPARKQLEKLTKLLKLTDQVTFYGETKWSVGISRLKTMDIVVNPSYSEGLPTSVIESALCQRAIIATDVGGTAEIIKNNESGLLVPPHDIDALTQSLQRLIDHPQQRVLLGRKAYEQVSARFSWKEATREYEQLFKLLID